MEHVLTNKINHAKLICFGHEDTKECRIAWDQVEDYVRAVRTANKKKHPPQKLPYSELALRDYEC
jgi:hypothetical protein